MRIRYGVGDLPLIGYSDSSFFDDLVDRRSTIAYAIRVAGGAVAWMSKKAPKVALSTTEVEYMALSQSAKQLIWTARTMEELGLAWTQLANLQGDNQGSIALAKNPEFHARTKHIDTLHHFIQEQVEKKVVQLTYCPTTQMLADGLTKLLGRQALMAKFEGLGLARDLM